MILESSCFLIKFINFNWRIIALQYHVGLCHTSTQISHRYTYVLSLLPTSHPFLSLCIVTETWFEFLSHTVNAYWLSILHMVV